MAKSFQKVSSRYRSAVVLCASVLVGAFVGGCGGKSDSTPTAPSAGTTTSWSAEQIRNQIVASNGIQFKVPPRDRLVRMQTAVAVNTNGIARAEEAVQRFERLTRGAITFVRVSGTPANGIVFVEGQAKNGDGSPGCGNVATEPGGQFNFLHYPAYPNRTGLPPADPSVPSNYTLEGTYYVNLGSPACNDTTIGRYPSAGAEHELGHALGLVGVQDGGHFDGFTGNEGLRSPNFLNVIYNLYRNAIGAPLGTLTIEIIPLTE